MKRFVLACVFVLAAISGSAALAEAFYPYPPAPVPVPVPVAVVPAGYSYAYCAAQTICPNGVPVSCYAYGSSFYSAACTWRVIPNTYIECTGFNDVGQWVVNWVRCY